MLCSTLSELPPPPLGKTGWPWTKETLQFPEKMPDGSEWPRITIVTPNYNYGHFLEETIRSILLQGYPNLEYIIMDGGSADNSIEIIRKYEPWLTYWESKPDRGQPHAINKGLEIATGEIFNWINSDDILSEAVLFHIATNIRNYDAFAGAVRDYDEQGNQEVVIQQNLSAHALLIHRDTTRKPLKNYASYHQPGFWIRTYDLKQLRLDENLHCYFDFDFAVKFLAKYPKVYYSNNIIVNFRVHLDAKTSNIEKFENERLQMAQNIAANPEYNHLSASIKIFLDKLEWSEFLTKSLNSSFPIRYIQALRIFCLSCLNPKIRWTRFTFGYIRKLIFT